VQPGTETPYVREDGYPDRYRDTRFREGHGPATHRRELRGLRRLLDLARRRGLVATGPWLDMPSGTGRFAATLPPPVVQCDRALSMVGASPVPGPRVCASGVALPFADDDFAGVLCMRLFQHLHAAPVERSAILRELRRVASGPLILSYFDSRSVQHLRRLLRRRLGKPKSGRGALPWRVFGDELRASGWEPTDRIALLPGWSEQNLVLCR